MWKNIKIFLKSSLMYFGPDHFMQLHVCKYSKYLDINKRMPDPSDFVLKGVYCVQPKFILMSDEKWLQINKFCK